MSSINSIREMANRRAGKGQKRKFKMRDETTEIKISVDQRPTDASVAGIVALVATSPTVTYSEPIEFGAAITSYSEQMAGVDAAFFVPLMHTPGMTADDAERLVQPTVDRVLGRTPSPVVEPQTPAAGESEEVKVNGRRKQLNNA